MKIYFKKFKLTEIQGVYRTEFNNVINVVYVAEEQSFYVFYEQEELNHGPEMY